MGLELWVVFAITAALAQTTWIRPLPGVFPFLGGIALVLLGGRCVLVATSRPSPAWQSGAG